MESPLPHIFTAFFNQLSRCRAIRVLHSWRSTDCRTDVIWCLDLRCDTLNRSTGNSLGLAKLASNQGVLFYRLLQIDFVCSSARLCRGSTTLLVNRALRMTCVKLNRLVWDGLLPWLLNQLHKLCLLLCMHLTHLRSLLSHLLLNRIRLGSAAKVAVRRVGRVLC